MRKLLLIFVFVPGILMAGGESFNAQLAFSTAAYSDSDFASEKVAILKRGTEIKIIDYKEGFYGVLIGEQLAYITESHIKSTREFQEFKANMFLNISKRKKSRNNLIEPEPEFKGNNEIATLK